ncbi:MAG: phenylalanine--tRNA ligase beta subunit-related protein [Candidatus Taylorbacteria bacterium]|nr:phenylalanine--tRNA ligase beta subunit-related protein [Candidatus Taylorbacteria bacterium]
MKCSYNWLNGFLKGKAPKPEEISELLTMNSMEVESIADFTRTSCGLDAVNDFVIDVKTLPNNNHSCLCHRGIAREVGVLSGIPVSKYSRDYKDFIISETNKKLTVKIVEPKLPARPNDNKFGHSGGCRRYAGRIVENIKVGPSPKWLKDYLEVLGQRSINNIVDATNFIMNEIGQPMHAFDADKLKLINADKNADKRRLGIEIVVKNAIRGQRIITLDKKDVELDENVLLITDGENPLAIAGIKGGNYAELDLKTTNIVLESASFDPVLIRKTAQRIKIQTDASKRYENDFSQEVAGEAMDILTKLIVEIAGTKDTKVGEVVDNYPKKPNKFKLGISSKEASQIIGVEIKDKDIEDIFNRFGFEYKKIKPIDEVLKLALTLVDTPYKNGASVSYDAPNVFDCSGFITYLFRESGVSVPRISVDQYVFGKMISEKDLKPGDTIYSNTREGKIHYETIEFLPGTKVPEGVDHCGLYIGDGKVIHATGLFGKVVVEELNKSNRFEHISGYRRMSENEERFVIIVPDERLDLRIKEDLAEEIGRIYGYSKIVDSKDIGNKLPVKIEKGFAYKEKIRRILYSEGFSEVMNYSFADKGEIELANPMSPEKKFLRSNLIDQMIKCLEFNSRYSELIDMPQIKIFEFGHVFSSVGERENLIIGVKNPLSIKKPKEKDVINNVIVLIEKELGIKLEKLNNNEFAVEFDFGSLIAKLPDDVSYELTEIGDKNVRFKSISQYPYMIRDVAVFTPDGTKPEEVFDIISSEINELVIKNNLFDVFNKKMEDGSIKISYAYRLIFQSYERTLSDNEVNTIMQKITDKLNSKLGWQVR